MRLQVTHLINKEWPGEARKKCKLCYSIHLGLIKKWSIKKMFYENLIMTLFMSKGKSISSFRTCWTWKKKINESNCYVIQEFLNGNLFTRWNNKCWGTLPTDLTIQQVLMESLKSIGGLYSWKRNGWSTLPYYTKITTKIEELRNSK